MLSRVFWVGIAGVALVTGMVLQDGDRIFSWGHEAGVTRSTEQAVQASVQRAIERGIEKAEITDSQGRTLDVSADQRRALGKAISELVDAQTDLAMVKISDGSAAELQAATARRDAARATVDQLKALIRNEDQPAIAEREAIREQVRDEIRTSVREAVAN
jgi:hypothetical protein